MSLLEKVKLTREVEVTVTAEDLGRVWAGMSSDAQAAFFAAAAEVLETWKAHERLMQAHDIGRKLRNPLSGSPFARDLVREICSAMEET